MKKIYIPYLVELNEIRIREASGILEDSGNRAAIEILNWPDQYPYRPITYVYIGRSTDSLFIKFTVNGTMLKAVYSEDQAPVREDSCVEFFCMPEGENRYTNFEFNCIGTCAAASRKNREEAIAYFSDEDMKKIERYPSIGRRTFKEMEGMFEWELTVKIPMRLMNIDYRNLPEKIRGNFYKCADNTNSAHYVSWSPINTESPDFHRPDFFGELYFVN